MIWYKMIRPLNGNIIISPIKRKETTKSGLYLPNALDQEEINKGKVIKVADDIIDIKENDFVLYKKFSPDIMTIEDKEYLTVKYEDVLAIDESDINERITISCDNEKDTLQPDNPKFKKAYPNADTEIKKER